MSTEGSHSSANAPIDGISREKRSQSLSSSLRDELSIPNGLQGTNSIISPPCFAPSPSDNNLMTQIIPLVYLLRQNPLKENCLLTTGTWIDPADFHTPGNNYKKPLNDLIAVHSRGILHTGFSMKLQ